MEHSSTPENTPVATAPSRRSFFNWLSYALSGLAVVLLGYPLLGFFFGLRKRSEDWIPLGDVKKFLPADPRDESAAQTHLVSFDNPNRQPWDGITAKTGVFVRYEGMDKKDNYQFMVLTVNCAHLGCPVSWFPQSGLFMCPCHGGVYYANGERASGPPPRGLFRCMWKVEDGQLKVKAPHYPTLQDTLGGDRETV